MFQNMDAQVRHTEVLDLVSAGVLSVLVAA